MLKTFGLYEGYQEDGKKPIAAYPAKDHAEAFNFFRQYIIEVKGKTSMYGHSVAEIKSERGE